MKQRMTLSVSRLSENRTSKGFTITELLIVIVVIAILAALTMVAYAGIRERTYFATASVNLNTIAKVMARYEVLYGSLPADTAVGIPAAIVSEMKGGAGTVMVDTGAWPGSYYDYEVWDLDSDGAVETYQISIRFCRDSAGQPDGEDGVNCKFPKEPWAANFIDISSVFYCLQGYCRAHKFRGNVNTPAYCLNCPNNLSIPVSG